MHKRSKDKVFKFVVALLLVAFCFGILELMALRFKMGDVYPAYSSLRTDPLGTKAYFESLNYINDISTSRNYQSIAEFQHDESATIFFFGMHDTDLYSMKEAQVGTLESLAANGNRVVLMLYPDFSNNRFRWEKGKKKEDKSQGESAIGEDKAEDSAEGENLFAESQISRSLRFSIDIRELDFDADIFQQLMGTLASDRGGLPKFIQWHSNIYFKDLDDKWDVVYELEGLPVMMERHFGAGSIVLSTDSYFVSNEAMLNDRHPGLLAWLVGINSRVVFDETHLGIGESPGIASLMRKYNLHGLLAGILVMAILFVWKNASSLVPPSAIPESTLPLADTQTGKDYSSGMVSLLRRNIPGGRILFTCFEEWKNAFPKKSEGLPEEMNRVRDILTLEEKRKSRNRNSVKAYRDISKILSERKSI